METLIAWWEALKVSLQYLWDSFVAFLPSLVGALIVFFVGWFVAGWVGKAVEKAIKALKIDKIVESEGIKKSFQKAGLNLRVAYFIGELVKWFLIIVVLMAASDILGLTQVGIFLTSVLIFIPNIVVAVIILIVAAILANFVYRVTEAAVMGSGFSSARFAAIVAKWSVLIFALLAALSQLGIFATFINSLWIGIIAMLALAGGLAFGLGGRDAAARFIEKVSQDINSRGRQ